MKRLIVLMFVVLVAARAIMASQFDLFSDEAFYWLCAQRPALAYADHPFMTAMLVRVGTALVGDTVLGVRLLFVLCGAALPFAVFALARPLVGSRDAWLAAGASMLLPLVTMGTVVATPDGILMLLAVCTLIAFERATRTGSTLAWCTAGLLSGLGLATHYRFTPVVLAALAWLVCTSRGRSLWRTPGPWIGAALTAAGLLPGLLFNLGLDFAPLRYQLMDRHTRPLGVLGWPVHLGEQALVTTPVLYVALLGALVVTVKAARRGDDRRALLAWFALIPMATYFLTSPLTDVKRTDVHWPLLGYLVLLPLLPAVLRGWAARGRVGWFVSRTGPALAFLVVAFIVVDALALPGGELPSAGFTGWTELGRATDEQLERWDESEDLTPPLVVADNYVTASQLQFHLRDRAEVYTMDHLVNDMHGRGLQFTLWRRGEAALREDRAGDDALLVVEISRTDSEQEEKRLRKLGRRFEDMRPIGEIAVDLGDEEQRRFLFFEAWSVKPVPPWSRTR